MPNRDKLPMIRDKLLDPKVKAEMARVLRRDGFTIRAIGLGLGLTKQRISQVCAATTCGK